MTTQTIEPTYVSLEHEFDPVPENLTVETLEQLRVNWLAYGQRLFDDLRMIILEMGNLNDSHGRVYHLLNVGDIRAYYYHMVGTYQTDKKQYSNSDVIYIWVGSDQVANLVRSNSPRANLESCIFVPGEWIARIMSLRGQAYGHYQAKKSASKKKRLDELS